MMQANPAIRSHVSLVLLAIVLLFSSGCQSTRSTGAAKPSAFVRSAKFNSIDVTRAAMTIDVDIINPYEAPLPLSHVAYKISGEGRQLVSGKTNLEGSVPAHQSKTINIPVEIKYADVRSALPAAIPGSVVPYKAELSLWVNAPESGPMVLNTLITQSQLPVPAAPSVTLSSVRWNALSPEQASATLNLYVTNRNQFALASSKVNCGLALAEVPIATAVASNTTNFSSEGSNDLVLPVSFSPKTLGPSVFNMLTGRGSQYQVKGEMQFTTAYGPMTLPFQQSGQTIFIH